MSADHISDSQPNDAFEPTIGDALAERGRLIERPPEITGDLDPTIDPTYRVGHLQAATQGVISVLWNDDISVATTEMLVYDFSQLAVTNGPRKVKGVISWKTIARRMLLCGSATKVCECVEDPREVRLGDPLLSAIRTIADHDYVLVKSEKNPMCGIVTAADLSLEFQRLTEPFLLIGQIERHMRQALHVDFSAQDLKDASSATRTGRNIATVADLTLGEFVRFIEMPSNWGKLKLQNIDKGIFLSHLKKVVDIRNKVMHFNAGWTQSQNDEGLKLLRSFAAFMLGTR